MTDPQHCTKHTHDRIRRNKRKMTAGAGGNLLALQVQPEFATFFLGFIRGDYNFLHLFHDLHGLDPELYRNLMFLKTYDGGDVEDLCLTFTVADEEFGANKEASCFVFCERERKRARKRARKRERNGSCRPGRAWRETGSGYRSFSFLLLVLVFGSAAFGSAGAALVCSLLLLLRTTFSCVDWLFRNRCLPVRFLLLDHSVSVSRCRRLISFRADLAGL